MRIRTIVESLAAALKENKSIRVVPNQAPKVRPGFTKRTVPGIIDPKYDRLPDNPSTSGPYEKEKPRFLGIFRRKHSTNPSK